MATDIILTVAADAAFFAAGLVVGRYVRAAVVWARHAYRWRRYRHELGAAALGLEEAIFEMRDKHASAILQRHADRLRNVQRAVSTW